MFAHLFALWLKGKKPRFQIAEVYFSIKKKSEPLSPQYDIGYLAVIGRLDIAIPVFWLSAVKAIHLIGVSCLAQTGFRVGRVLVLNGTQSIHHLRQRTCQHPIQLLEQNSLSRDTERIVDLTCVHTYHE